jgi:hypothetical protein
MIRKVVTYLLFAAVVVYGTGLPRLVHYLVDHQGWGMGGAAVAHVGCCSHTCQIHPVAQQDDVEAGVEEEHQGDCGDTHDCNVCAMLACSFAAVSVVASVMQLHGGLPALADPAPRSITLSLRTEPHIPRGPPIA